MKNQNQCRKGLFHRSILLFAVISVFISTMVGCTNAPVVDTKAESEKIIAFQNEWIVAYQNKDVEKIMSVYSADAIVIAPNTPVATGTEEIRKNLEVLFSDTTMVWKDFTWTNDLIEVSASGDMAYVFVSAVTPVITPEGLKEVKSKGIDIWKKINGEWKAVVDSWNNQLPGPGY